MLGGGDLTRPPVVDELAWEHGVDADAVSRPGVRVLTRHLHHAALGGAVGEIAAAKGRQPGDRAEVDDAAATAGRYHPAGRRLGAQKVTGEVGSKHLIPRC